LAEENVTTGRGGPFGAVIVCEDRIIARGTNRVTANWDPTAHAEVVAIRAACQARHDYRLAGCQLYPSCEPCPLCLAAILWARLDAVHYAATSDQAAAAGFDDRAIYAEIAKPKESRALPMFQALATEAAAPFQAWSQSPNRIPY
jgi:guanine deaminase